MRDPIPSRSVIVTVLPLLCFIAGCGSELDRYKPTTALARTSLESALSAWRDGKPYGPIETTPPVQVGDVAWESGQQLESFTIGDEIDEGDGTKQFVVTLKMKKAPAEQSVKYFVHGRDPVWVYREENYKRMIGMDNNPTPAASGKSAGRSSGARK